MTTQWGGRSFLRKLSWLARRRDRENELAAELRFHFEEEAEARREAGLAESEARWAARRDLGNAGLIKEDAHAAWGWIWVDQLAQDLRYAARTMIHHPAFTLLAALSLALGIGANTAIYSFMDTLLMRSLPVENPESLVVLNWHVKGKSSEHVSVVHDVSGFFHDDPKPGKTTGIFPYPAFELLRQSDRAFSVVFAHCRARRLNVMIRQQAEVVSGDYVSGDFFRGLALAPASGRLISGDDDRAGALEVVVLSYAFAQRRFGDVANAVGQPVFINNIPFTAIGVAPPGFFGVDPGRVPDFYVPMHADLVLDPEREPSGTVGQRYVDEHYYWVEMMARLRPGVSMAQAQAVAGQIFETWVATTATNQEERNNLPKFLLKAGAGGLDNLRREYSQPLYILLAMAGLILAIACANIANLLLARATARRREMAVRLSMGAARGRVIRQLLTESLLLASIGGAVGILFAVWGMRFLTVLLASGGGSFKLRRGVELARPGRDGRARDDHGIILRAGSGPSGDARGCDAGVEGNALGRQQRRGWLRFSLSQTLVASQMAISLLLLVASGLFVRTLSNLNSVELGFQRENILLFKLNASQAGHRDPEILSFYSDLQKRFAASSGGSQCDAREFAADRRWRVWMGGGSARQAAATRCPQRARFRNVLQEHSRPGHRAGILLHDEDSAAGRTRI